MYPGSPLYQAAIDAQIIDGCKKGVDSDIAKERAAFVSWFSQKLSGLNQAASSTLIGTINGARFGAADGLRVGVGGIRGAVFGAIVSAVISFGGRIIAGELGLNATLLAAGTTAFDAVSADVRLQAYSVCQGLGPQPPISFNDFLQ